MKIPGFSIGWPKRGFVPLLALSLWLGAGAGTTLRADDPAPAVAYQPQSAARLQQSVAPLALYPDSLVAQILAASTFPEQVVEADRWVQAHPGLKGQALAAAVDQQVWDPSVKALTAFPNVLGNMDKNLSWTSSLGDAYYNQPQDVMDAVQVMRRRAQAAGTLRSTPQQTVTTEDSAISIQPESPSVVYVPAYDPWTDYGDPVDAWPGWYEYPGVWFAGPSLSFGVGFGIGFYGGFAWGSPHWGFDWRNRSVMYNHNRYYSRSNTFYNRDRFYRGMGRGGNGMGRRAPFGAGGRGEMGRGGGTMGRPFGGNPQGARGFAEPRGQSGVRSGAFGGYQHGGEARDFSSRGSSSMGNPGSRGGGDMRGGSGGGGMRGGGGGGGMRGGGGGGGMRGGGGGGMHRK